MNHPDHTRRKPGTIRRILAGSGAIVGTAVLSTALAIGLLVSTTGFAKAAPTQSAPIAATQTGSGISYKWRSYADGVEAEVKNTTSKTVTVGAYAVDRKKRIVAVPTTGSVVLKPGESNSLSAYLPLRVTKSIFILFVDGKTVVNGTRAYEYGRHKAPVDAVVATRAGKIYLLAGSKDAKFTYRVGSGAKHVKKVAATRLIEFSAKPGMKVKWSAKVGKKHFKGIVRVA